MKQERLTEGQYYHIYNRGNNRRDLFLEPVHYEHFLALYDKFITPVAETLAWVLMPNHFHLVVRIKENMVYKYSNADVARKLDSNADRSIDAVRFSDKTTGADLTASARPVNVEITSDNVEHKLMNKAWFEDHKWETIELESFNGMGNPKKPVPHRHFAHLFNAYARYFNKLTDGTGNLFERPFKRKKIHNEGYLKQVILYVHNNPIHHGFCKHLLEYPWSSYITCISEKPTKLKRRNVLKLFNERDNFKKQHDQQLDTEKIEKWLELDEVDYSRESDNQVNADRLKDEATVADLSASERPDNVEKDEKSRIGCDQFNADRSENAVRLEEEATAADLSASERPDNVEEKIKEKIRYYQFNADRSADAVRLPNEATAADLSVPIAIGIRPDNVEKENQFDAAGLGDRLGDNKIEQKLKRK